MQLFQVKRFSKRKGGTRKTLLLSYTRFPPVSLISASLYASLHSADDFVFRLRQRRLQGARSRRTPQAGSREYDGLRPRGNRHLLAAS